MTSPTVLCAGLFGETVLGISDYIKTHDPLTQARVVKGRPNRDVHRGVKGVIAHITHKEDALDAKKLGVPVVNTSGVQEGLSVPSVYVDDDAVGRLAAGHLQAKGYTRFACVGRTWEAFSRRRQKAFCAMLKRAGLECDTFTEDAHLASPASRRKLLKWMKTLAGPVALFAVTDDIGAECVTAAQEIGIVVPRDMAIVGVGDTPGMCEAVHPALSSVRIPWRLLGYKAAELLYRQLKGRRVANKPKLLQPEGVVARQSSDSFAVEDNMVAAALRFIADHVHERINVEDLLRAVPVSRRVLEHKFSEHVGRTPLKEIHRQRIERAQELLVRTDLTVEAVGLRSGFANKVRFTEAFKRLTGITPTEYRSRVKLTS